VNIEQAILSHRRWKAALGLIVCGHQQPDPAYLERDDACEVGRWLAGEAAQAFGDLPDFAEVCQAHRAFHLTCAAVMRLAMSGNTTGAAAMLAPGGEISRASERLTRAFRLLQRQPGRN